MTLDIAQPEKDILKGFQASLRENIHRGSKKVQVKVYEPAHEKDDLFVLFYAFYKDDAYARRLSIPTYREMHAGFQRKRAHSYLLFAYFENMPVAVLWVTRRDNQLVIHASGSITLGYELHGDAALFWEAIKLGKKLQLLSVTFDSESLFHGIIGL